MLADTPGSPGAPEDIDWDDLKNEVEAFLQWRSRRRLLAVLDQLARRKAQHGLVSVLNQAAQLKADGKKKEE